jgi:NAD(P)H-dependent nitrite reductase small subunit
MEEVKDGFYRICKLGELTEKIGKKFFINETEIAVFKINGKVYAVNNICPHKQSAIIYDGFVEDETVTCPSHGWIFDLKTGRMANGSKGLDSYETKVENEIVYAKVIPKKVNWTF